jgi:diacylglycerol kinase family enzyme
VNVFVGNAPGLGRLGLVLGGDVLPDDGLLDVILVDATPGSLVGMAARAVRLDAFGGSLRRWRARTVTIDADPPQPVHADGEALAPTPVTLHVQPDAVRVVVPL